MPLLEAKRFLRRRRIAVLLC